MAIPGIGEIWAGISSSYHGIESVWEGTANGYNLIWEPWYFKDDFERSYIGMDWITAGSVIENGELKKNTINGSADNWTARSFPHPDLRVVVTLGRVTDKAQRSAIVIGRPSEYLFCEFSSNGGVIGDYDGNVWSNRANVPAMSLVDGDTIEVYRWGTSVSFLRNGYRQTSAVSSFGRGGSNWNPQVNLSVRRDSNIFGTYYSPTFDDVKIGRYIP